MLQLFGIAVLGCRLAATPLGGTKILQTIIIRSNKIKQGEKVCIVCGRIELQEARFCQEGHALFRKCIFQNCQHEFAVDHQRCDFCGRLQSPSFEEAKLLLAAGDKIGAIKLVRVATDLGLAEAKELVESWGNASEAKPNSG